MGVVLPSPERWEREGKRPRKRVSCGGASSGEVFARRYEQRNGRAVRSARVRTLGLRGNNTARKITE